MSLVAFSALILTKGSAGIGGIPPVLLPDVPLWSVIGFAALNPVTIAVAWIMGRNADAPAKILVAGFAAALAGALALWLGTLLRLSFLATPARAAAGIFAIGIVFAMAYAAAAYAVARNRSRL
jgi:hypothetical protein